MADLSESGSSGEVMEMDTRVARDAHGCRVPGCPEPKRARGFCRAHYAKKLRNGELPPKLRTQPKVRMKLYITRKQYQKLLELAGKNHKSHSSMLRTVLDKFFMAYDKATAAKAVTTTAP